MNLGKLVQIVKEYVTYTQYSDERLLNDMLACFVITYDLKLHNSEEPLYFDKSYTSKIVRNSVRIPPQLCGVINDNTQGKAYEYFCRFYTKHITGEKGKRLREVLLSVISSDNSFPDTTKNILSETTNDCRFLYLCMISALRVENNLKRNYECETIIYENGNNYLRVVAGDIFRYAFPNRKKAKQSL